jgi:hypothetical protein
MKRSVSSRVDSVVQRIWVARRVEAKRDFFISVARMHHSLQRLALAGSANAGSRPLAGFGTSAYCHGQVARFALGRLIYAKAPTRAYLIRRTTPQDYTLLSAFPIAKAISLRSYRKRAPAPGMSQSRFGTWEITGSYGPSYQDC